MQTLKNILTFPVKILIFVFGLAMLYWGAEGLLSNTAEWISIEAQVVSSIEQTSGEDGTSSDYKITYEYQVGAETYTDSYTRYAALPVGKKITIYYDPASPKTSATSPAGYKWESFINFIVGLGCVIWLAKDAYTAIRRKPAEPTETN